MLQRRTQSLLTVLSATALAAASLTGCRRSEPPSPAPPAAVSEIRILDIAIGSAATPEGKITQPVQIFRPDDTVIVSASLAVPLAPSATTVVSANWNYRPGAGKPYELLKSDSLLVRSGGTQIMTFRLANPAGLKPGDYRADVLLNKISLGERKFTVQ